MKKLKRFCLVILIASVVCCAAVLINSSNKHTIQEAMAAHYGTEQSQEVYSTVQAEIANILEEQDMKKLKRFCIQTYICLQTLHEIGYEK